MASKERRKSSLRALREDVERRELEVRKRLLEANVSCFESVVDPREAYFDAEDQWLPVGHAGVPPQTDSRKLGEVLPVYLDESGLRRCAIRAAGCWRSTSLPSTRWRTA